MGNFYRYKADPKGFNRIFTDNSPTIATLCFFCMNLYVNDYKTNPAQIFSQDSFSFDVLNFIELEKNIGKRWILRGILQLLVLLLYLSLIFQLSCTQGYEGLHFGFPEQRTSSVCNIITSARMT